MRVLFITNSLQTGGAEKVFMLDARELSKRGHEVHFLLLFKAGELAESAGIAKNRVHIVGMRSIFDIAGFFRALRIVRSICPEVMYSTLNEGNFVARVLALFTRKTHLFTREANMADVKSRLYRWSDILFGWRSSAIVAVSKAVGESVCLYAPYLKSRIRVLYNPVSMPPESKRAAHGSVRLLNVGSLTPKKDQQLLVRALTHLAENVSLTLVGDGQERKKLEALAHELGIAERTTFAGAVLPERVGEYYASHDVFVLTSSREGCPNVVLEALSYCLPVVAFDISGMDEFVSSRWGICVRQRDPAALAEALKELISSADTRLQKGRAGLEHVQKNHSVKRHINELSRMLTG